MYDTILSTANGPLQQPYARIETKILCINVQAKRHLHRTAAHKVRVPLRLEHGGRHPRSRAVILPLTDHQCRRIHLIFVAPRVCSGRRGERLTATPLLFFCQSRRRRVSGARPTRRRFRKRLLFCAPLQSLRCVHQPRRIWLSFGLPPMRFMRPFFRRHCAATHLACARACTARTRARRGVGGKGKAPACETRAVRSKTLRAGWQHDKHSNVHAMRIITPGREAHWRKKPENREPVQP